LGLLVEIVEVCLAKIPSDRKMDVFLEVSFRCEIGFGFERDVELLQEMASTILTTPRQGGRHILSIAHQ
jgi:hypothetical protein